MGQVCGGCFAGLCPNRALIDAVRAGDEEKVASLLKAGTPLETTDKDGWTALQWAAVEGNDPILRLLIQAGAKVDARNNKNCKRVALHEAAVYGAEGSVVQLIAAKANINAKDEFGSTPLACAKLVQDTEKIQQLLREAGGQE